MTSHLTPLIVSLVVKSTDVAPLKSPLRMTVI